MDRELIDKINAQLHAGRPTANVWLGAILIRVDPRYGHITIVKKNTWKHGCKYAPGKLVDGLITYREIRRVRDALGLRHNVPMSLHQGRYHQTIEMQGEI